MRPNVARSSPTSEGLSALRPRRPGGSPRGLYVADQGAGVSRIDILHINTWAPVGSITNGLKSPHGEWFDHHGNFYVTNDNGANVTEYAPGASTPTFTYSTGIADPVTVVTDNSGNVYVADFNRLNPGYVEEYAQGSNTLIQRCTVPGSPTGLTFNSSGNLYVAYLNSLYTGSIEELTVSSCTATTLGVTTGYPGSLAIDDHNNLIVPDQIAVTIDIIAPPYNSVTKTLTNGLVQGDSDPIAAALGGGPKKNKWLFVADARNSGIGDVLVLRYPSGNVVATLGASNGISWPLGVVDARGYIP